MNYRLKNDPTFAKRVQDAVDAQLRNQVDVEGEFLDADSIQQNSIFNSYESLPATGLLQKKSTHKTTNLSSKKDLENSHKMMPYNAAVSAVNSQTSSQRPLDRDVKTIIMSGDLEEESDSFSEHDSIDSYEQITIKAS